MFSTLQSIILGAVQGLTEFLPVSSSAHLILVPWLLKWQDPGLAFDVALHLGTLLALLAYYWRQWLDMGLSLANGQKLPRRLLLLLIVASIPGAIIGLLLEKQAETIFRSPVLIAFDLAVMGIALWIVDAWSAQRRGLGEIGFFDAFVIGLSQALAIVPGVSRSGATITAARILGIDRESAANFSFLMATPIIAGAGMMEIHKALRDGLTAQITWGFVAAAIFGVIAIAGLLQFVRLRSYAAFSVYRIALAILVIAVFIARG
jgi:undecaprenyl-diphosphatase